MEKAENEKKDSKELQKAIEEEVILNEKEQLRLEQMRLERMEEARVASEASEDENDETHVEDHAPGVEQQGTEEYV